MQTLLSAPKIESMNAIISVVALYYDIPPEKIFAERRKTEPYASARKIICCLFHEFYSDNTSMKKIAQHFNRNHTAFLFHYQDLSSRLHVYRQGSDDKTCEEYYEIRKMLPPDLITNIRAFAAPEKVLDRLAKREKKMSMSKKIDAIYDMLKELSARNGHSKN